MGKVIKPFSYTRVQDQGDGYLKRRFDKIRRELKESAAKEQQKVSRLPVRRASK